MRSPEDLIRLRVTLYALVDLDKERIESDPAWDEVSKHFNLEDPAQNTQALYRYLGFYINREQLFDNKFMPATNGPSDLFITDMELIKDEQCQKKQ